MPHFGYFVSERIVGNFLYCILIVKTWKIEERNCTQNGLRSEIRKKMSTIYDLKDAIWLPVGENRKALEVSLWINGNSSLQADEIEIKTASFKAHIPSWTTLNREHKES